MNVPSLDYMSVDDLNEQGQMEEQRLIMELKTGLDDGPPLPKNAIDAWRNPKIIKMRENGLSLRAIATKFNLSHEGVRAILTRNGIL